MLGLKTGTVKIVPHCYSWAALFRAERTRLLSALGRWADSVEHVGSTAVAGLESKPILDIAVGIRPAADIEHIKDALLKLGYTFLYDAGPDGGHIFCLQHGEGVHTHYVHIVRKNGRQWVNYLTFRNQLRNDSKVRQEYAKLKRDLFRQYRDDREQYTKAKSDFIERVLQQCARNQSSR